MRKKLWICLALLFVIPGLLFTVSCAKKTVKSDSSMTQMSQADQQAKQEEARRMQEDQAKQAEQEKQRALEEARLKEQRLREQQLAEKRRQAEIAQRLENAKKKTFLGELILFDYDSSVLTATAQDRLVRKADWLKENPNVKVIIEGHCDERGTVEYNLALGERRAEAAKAFLVDLGISASRLTTISYGKERPFSKGHYEGAWAKNRRAHFVVE